MLDILFVKNVPFTVNALYILYICTGIIGLIPDQQTLLFYSYGSNTGRIVNESFGYLFVEISIFVCFFFLFHCNLCVQLIVPQLVASYGWGQGFESCYWKAKSCGFSANSRFPPMGNVDRVG